MTLPATQPTVAETYDRIRATRWAPMGCLPASLK